MTSTIGNQQQDAETSSRISEAAIAGVEVQQVAPPPSESRNADRRLRRWAIPAAALFFTIGLSFIYRPLSQPERGDAAIYDYIAQTILRGGLPYRDVVDPKAPGAMYVSALAMWAGRQVRVDDVLAVRYVYILLAGILSVLIVLVAQQYFSSNLAAILAFLIPLLPSRYSLMMIDGTQPKLVMMVFAMLALLFIARDRPLWAGFCSMMSCLCWQPGLLFAGVAFLIFSRYLRSWRDLRALAVVAGALIPLAAVLIYFYLRGALADLWSWAFTYDYKVFMPAGIRPRGQALHEIITVMLDRVFLKDIVFVVIAIAGLVFYAYERVRDKLRGKRGLDSADLYKDALVMPPLIYFAFCILNFQSSPDTIPFFPFIGLFGAWFFVKGSHVLDQHVRVGRLTPRLQLQRLLPAIAIVLIIFITVRNAAAYRLDARTLSEEYEGSRVVASYLSPSDKIYVHGPAEVLVLLDRPNLNPYIALDSGADDYIASLRPGGFGALVDEIEAARPKLVVMGRLQNVRHRAELERWVDSHYVKLDIPWLNNVYIRKSDH
jgi:hypothetical protein